MRVLLISDLPEFLDLFGLRHHYPPVPGTPADGMEFTRIGMPGDDGQIDGLLSDLLAKRGSEGPVLAHVSGTTARTARIAEELVARKVPFLYSPMLPSYPSRVLEILGRFPGVRTGAPGDLRSVVAIAPAARMVLAPDTLSHGSLRRVLTMPTGRLHRVGEPAASGPMLPESRGAGGGGAIANLAVAFCDVLSPEWNAQHFLAAMEKINADAVVVAGKSEGEYARACAERAAANPRVRFLFHENRGIGAIAGEVEGLMGRASIVVDPSLGGLGGGVVAAASEVGVPAVISHTSARVLPKRDQASRVSGYHLNPVGTFTFEPSSWELLHHAIVCAFNASAGVHARPETGAPAGKPDHSTQNEAIAATLRELYKETVALG